VDWLRVDTKREGGSFERLEMPRFPYRRSEAEANDLILFPAPEARHEQDVGLNACITQGDGLVERSYTEPLSAFGFECARTFHRAVAVRVSLHNGANVHSPTDMLLHDAKVLTQSLQRDFSPGRASRTAYSAFYAGCDHDLAIISVAR